MTPELRRRLIGCLGMLASSHDGERAAAGLLACRLLKSAGVTWDEVIPERPLVARASEDWVPDWHQEADSTLR